MIRPELPKDIGPIHALTQAAFKDAEHSSQTEAAIVGALRAAGVLSVSLVAEIDGVVVGHVAFSPVTITGEASDWYGLGPVSVLPSHQGRGIGQALIRQGLEQLQSAGAGGCVVLGNPDYYGRFGFRNDARLRLPDVPAQYFQCLAFNGGLPDADLVGEDMTEGDVAYHQGFGAV